MGTALRLRFFALWCFSSSRLSGRPPHQRWAPETKVDPQSVSAWQSFACRSGAKCSLRRSCISRVRSFSREVFFGWSAWLSCMSLQSPEYCFKLLTFSPYPTPRGECYTSLYPPRLQIDCTKLQKLIDTWQKRERIQGSTEEFRQPRPCCLFVLGELFFDISQPSAYGKKSVVPSVFLLCGWRSQELAPFCYLSRFLLSRPLRQFPPAAGSALLSERLSVVSLVRIRVCCRLWTGFGTPCIIAASARPGRYSFF